MKELTEYNEKPTQEELDAAYKNLKPFIESTHAAYERFVQLTGIEDPDANRRNNKR